MKQALKLAAQAYSEGEVPIGAVIVSNQQIIGKGYNQVEKLGDATAEKIKNEHFSIKNQVKC